MAKYRERIADKLLARNLAGIGAVLIEGPKWCGKTTTAEQLAKSIIYMDDPTHVAQNLLKADINPKSLLVGETPRLIDEWQIAPKIWDAIRFEVDHRDGLGHFILTGSSVPVDNTAIRHSGAGRFAWFRMRPMSLYESGESTGGISLETLFQRPASIYAENGLDMSDIAYLICRGGWPKALGLPKDIALDQAFNYCDAITNRDISKVDNITRNPERIKRLMRSYARLQGSQASYETIGQDIKGHESQTLSPDSIASYVLALKKLFVVEDVRVWNTNLRSKTAIRSSDTRYYTDPSIGTAILKIGPNDLLNDLNTCGLFFETLCIRDLRTYAEALLGEVYHYRDAKGLECDAVVHLRDGRYGLVEIKLGGERLIEEGAKTLFSLSKKLDTAKMKEPSFLMVLVGVGDIAYRRPDGVYVVPIGCLKP
ncbi:MAG: DUF4143 domain-containing protein [Bacteroidales bacterium]|nr:DUF4143 domain-containing protein [Bacteroidales bacterium]